LFVTGLRLRGPVQAEAQPLALALLKCQITLKEWQHVIFDSAIGNPFFRPHIAVVLLSYVRNAEVL